MRQSAASVSCALAVLAAEHAAEAGQAHVHLREHFVAFADPADEGVAEPTDTRPDRTLGVRAGAVGTNAVGPDAPVSEAAVVGDVARRQPPGEARR